MWEGHLFHYLQSQKTGYREIKRLAQCHFPSSVVKNMHLNNLLTPRLVTVLFFKHIPSKVIYLQLNLIIKKSLKIMRKTFKQFIIICIYRSRDS